MAPADVSVGYANQVMNDLQALLALLRSVQGLTAVNTTTPLGNAWNVLNTCVTAADGTIGAEDGTPNTAHLIDSNVYPNLQRAVSATQLGQMLQVLVDFQTFCAGTSLAANASRPAQILFGAT